MEYAIYGRWDHGLSIDEPTLQRLDAAFRPNDPEACVGIEPDALSVLRVSFDMDAVSDEDAISQGLQELESTCHGGGCERSHDRGQGHDRRPYVGLVA
jgi:hypothetical protein